MTCAASSNLVNVSAVLYIIWSTNQYNVTVTMIGSGVMAKLIAMLRSPSERSLRVSCPLTSRTRSAIA